jgi:hypothetical protein
MLYAKQSALSSAVLQHQLKIFRYKFMRILAVHVDCPANMTLSPMLSMPSHMQIHAAAYCKLWKCRSALGLCRGYYHKGHSIRRHCRCVALQNGNGSLQAKKVDITDRPLAHSQIELLMQQGARMTAVAQAS